MQLNEEEIKNWDKGWFTLDGCLMIQQSPRIIDAFRQLFAAKQPKQILEIGAQAGGLTLCISYILQELNLETKIKSFDVKHIPGREYVEERFKNVEFIIDDIFIHSYYDLKDEKRENVKDFIQQEGSTIILCDGGSKKNEFRILSEYLKPGDIIMAHDYSPNEEYFNSVTRPQGVWGWQEISDNDVRESMEKFNLKFYMFETFRDAAWLCTVKAS